MSGVGRTTGGETVREQGLTEMNGNRRDSLVTGCLLMKIVINNERELIVSGGKSLFATLTENGIPVPSICGGRSLCGRCKVKVLSEVGELSPAEKKWLSEEEIADGKRLSCQITVQDDIEIELPESALGLREYQAKGRGTGWSWRMPNGFWRCERRWSDGIAMKEISTWE